jgi:hypothetical protein
MQEGVASNERQGVKSSPPAGVAQIISPTRMRVALLCCSWQMWVRGAGLTPARRKPQGFFQLPTSLPSALHPVAIDTVPRFPVR